MKTASLPLRAHNIALLFTLLGLGACATTADRGNTPWDPAKRADVHAQLAASYMQRNQLETARDELQEALAIKADHSRANYVMAILQTRLNNPREAERFYKIALRSDPENSEAAHDYGIFLCRRGRVDAAIENFEAALANPLYKGVALTNLRAGECLITARTDRRGAEPYLRAALAINPNLAPALFRMAEVQYFNKEYLSARGYIERFFSLADVTPQSLLLAVKIEKQLGAHDVAQDYAKELKSRFASSEQAGQLRNIE